MQTPNYPVAISVSNVAMDVNTIITGVLGLRIIKFSFVSKLSSHFFYITFYVSHIKLDITTSLERVTHSESKNMCSMSV